MESVFYNGGMIGTTLDFGATDQYITTGGTTNPTTVSFVASAISGSANNSVTTITIPATAQVGDIAILADGGYGTQSGSAPAGWTLINSAGTGAGTTSFMFLMYKKLLPGDPGSTISIRAGVNASRNIMAVFRPNQECIVTVINSVAQVTDANPAAQTITMAGQSRPVIGFANYYSSGVVSPRTSSLSMSEIAGSSTSHYLKYITYAANAGSDGTVDMDDEGNQNNLISGSLRLDPTTSTAFGNKKNSGVWNIQAAYEEVYSNLPVDPNFANVSLLLHGDGANNGTTITDSSSNAVAFTRVNSPVTSTAQSKFGGSSIWFERATGDFLSKTSSTTDALFTFGTGDFTIECWLYLNSPPTVGQNIIDFRPVGVHGAHVLLTFFSDSTLTFWANTAQRIVGPVLSTGQWYHIALSRVSSNTRMFVNGSQVGTTYADSTNYLLGGSDRPYIGSGSFVSGGDNRLDGYIDELRITKGVGRYAANFTVPTQPYPDQ